MQIIFNMFSNDIVVSAPSEVLVTKINKTVYVRASADYPRSVDSNLNIHLLLLSFVVKNSNFDDSFIIFVLQY